MARFVNLANLARQSFAHFFVCSVVHSSCLGFSVANRQFDCDCCAETATSLATGSAERQTSRAHQLGSVGKEVTFTVDEEVFVAVRRRGRKCTEKGLWLACESASDSTGGRALHDNAVVFFMLDSLMLSLSSCRRDTEIRRNVSGADRRETGFFSSLSGILASLTQLCVHISLEMT